jgi:hypothetical protein
MSQGHMHNAKQLFSEDPEWKTRPALQQVLFFQEMWIHPSVMTEGLFQVWSELKVLCSETHG